MEQMYWKHFLQTGKVEDYLFYRGMETCRKVIDKYGDKKSESGNCSNGHGTVGITDRRI